MERQTITFTADQQALKKTGGESSFATNTVSYIDAVFTLGNNWQFDNVSAIWQMDGVGDIATKLDHNGMCEVPHEMVRQLGYVKVNLAGSITDGTSVTERLTTYTTTALVMTGEAKVAGGETVPITPSQYEQFVANVKADADRAEAGADEAEASAQSASESATASANSATSSAQSATASAQSAQNASESATSAETAKDDAENARDEILGMRATAETLEAGSDATASYSDGLLTLGIPRGDKGEQGIQGETGATPNLTIGTVETLAPTEDATASITGTAENPVLNLGIPKGEQGEVSLEDLEALLPTDTASGDIASITDGQSVVPVKSLKVTLEPIQDLHGYDKPWSGGAGKNKANIDGATNLLGMALSNGVLANTLTDSKNQLALYAATYKESTLVERIISVAYSPSVGRWSGRYTINNTDFDRIRIWHSGSTQDLSTYIPCSVPTTGNYMLSINFLGVSPNVVGGFSFKEVQFEAGSTATSYAPYSNICPISGHTECVTEVRGKNLLNPTFSDWSTAGTYLHINDVLPTETTARMTFIDKDTSVSIAGLYIGWVYEDVTATNAGYYNWCIESGTKRTNTLNESTNKQDTKICRNIFIYPNTQEAFNKLFARYDIQVELGTTATDYHAYDGHTYTTDLGRTVYGGTLDIVSGELVVDRAYRSVTDMPANGWNKLSSGSGAFYMARVYAFPNMKYPYENINPSYPISDTYVYSPSGTQPNGAFRASDALYIVDDRYSTIAEFQEAYAQNPFSFVYELATPQTIQLTPQEVELLTGTNNVWSDGNVTLVYSADIQRYIEKKLGTRTTLTMSRPTVEPLKSVDTVESSDTVDTEQV